MKIVICIIGIATVLFIANRVMNRITNAVYKCMGFDIDKISEEYSEKLIKKIKKWLRKYADTAQVVRRADS